MSLQILSRSSLRKYSSVRLVTTQDTRIVNIYQAYDYAQENGLDLVLVSDKVSPPVVKTQDFKKLQYEKNKARNKSKNKQNIGLKEIQFKVNISEHDLNTKVKSIKKFIEKTHKVKITVKLKGREKESPQKAYDLINKISESMECKVNKVKSVFPSVILEPIKVKK